MQPISGFARELLLFLLLVLALVPELFASAPTSSPFLRAEPTASPVVSSPTSSPISNSSPTSSPISNSSPTSSPISDTSPTSSPAHSPTSSPTHSPTPTELIPGSESDSPTSSPTQLPTSSPSPFDCTVAKSSKECQMLGGAQRRCEWFAPTVCGTPINNCKTINYGCRDSSFCEIDTATFRPRLQCDQRALNCYWTGSDCTRICPSGVAAKPYTTQPTCAMFQLAGATSKNKATMHRGTTADGMYSDGFAGNADFDGDGITDMAVGTPDLPPKFSPDRDGTGGVSLILSQFPGEEFLLVGQHLEGRFGSVIEFVDLNKDGLSELVISAPLANANGAVRSGIVYIIWGSRRFAELHRAGAYSNLLLAPPELVTRISGTGSMSTFGMSLARAGDVNGDGYHDLLVGAPAASLTGRYACGQVTLVLGSEKTNALRTIVFSGKQAFGYFGTSVAGGGDFDGDGFADILVGSPWFKSGQGEAVLIYGKRTLMGDVDLAARDDSAFKTLPKGDAGSTSKQVEYFGAAVAFVGDINVDGVDDIAVGAPYYSSPTSQQVGRVYLYFGNKTRARNSLLSVQVNTMIDGPAAGDRFGTSIAKNGFLDFNGDGFADMLVGFPQKQAMTQGPSTGGAAVIYGDCLGFASNISLSAQQTTFRSSIILGPQSNNANLGQQVYACGDLNQDGSTELCLSAPYASSKRGQFYSVLSTC